MATRNRTNLYISYRQSYAHHPTQYTNFTSASMEELDQLIPGQEGGDVTIEMDILPPAWADTTQQVDEILLNITRMSTKLDRLHARHVLPGFDDKSEEEGEIERLTNEITKVSILSKSYVVWVYCSIVDDSNFMNVRNILKRFNDKHKVYRGQKPQWQKTYKSL